METILMLLQLVQKLKDTVGLNPFYIMETILMGPVAQTVTIRWASKSLNPFYIMETILMNLTFGLAISILEES